MREFVVEVPVYVRVAIKAADTDTAALVGKKFVEEQMERPHGSIERVGGIWQFVVPEIVPVEEDAEPDVYICSGGKLTYVPLEGPLVPTGDDCDLAA